MALQFTEREFIPVLLGGDINAYLVARAFYEEYQVKSWSSASTRRVPRTAARLSTTRPTWISIPCP